MIALGLLVAATTATMAVFSDQDKVLGNTISAAHLTIDAREVLNKPLVISHLLPGEWSETGTVDLYNDGDVPQRQWMYVENIQGALCSYVTLKIGYSWGGVGDFDHTFGQWSLWSLNGAANKKLVGREDPIMPDDPAHTYISTTRLVQKALLDTSTPNSFNTDPSATCTWDEVFVATQPGM